MEALNLIAQKTIYSQVRHVMIAIIPEGMFLQWTICN